MDEQDQKDEEEDKTQSVFPQKILAEYYSINKQKEKRKQEKQGERILE